MNKRQLNPMKVFRFKRFTRKSYSAFNSLHKAVTIGVLSGCTLMSAHAASVNPVERVKIETSSDTIPQRELDEVVVTASKVDLPLNLAAKQVTVISRKDIERAPVKSVQDLLNYVAGVDVLQRGPHGVQADISLRGGSFDQAAILLNGINLTNPQTGHYSLDIPVNLSDIERIEIVQGPSSLLYGAGALSGGINIITKKDVQDNAFFKLEGGIHALFGGEARGAYRTRGATHSLSAGYARSAGYLFASDGRPRSDYNIGNLLWQSRFEIDCSKLDVQMGYNDKKYGANTFYTPQYPDQYEKTTGTFASIKGETGVRLKFIPQIYWNRHGDCYQLYRDGTPDIPNWYKGHNYHRSDVFGINLNMQYASAWGITSVGGEFRNEGVLSNKLGHPMDTVFGNFTKSYNRSNISYFVEHNFIYRQFTLSLGGLLNYNTAIVNKYRFYPAVNASFRATNALSFYASWSKSTRMPSFTDLFYNTPTHNGNDKLLPEYSQATEAGVKFRNRILSAQTAIFYNIGDNLIDWIKPTADAAKWQSINRAQVKLAGVEAQTSFNLEEWLGASQPLRTLQLGYQYINQLQSDASPNDPISGYTMNFLKHKFTANLHHNIVKNLSVTWNFRWQDRAGSYVQYVNLKAGEKVSYKPFSVLDVKVNYALNNLNIFANANNIFNTTFVDLGNIPQPGFWLTGGVSYTIR